MARARSDAKQWRVAQSDLKGVRWIVKRFLSMSTVLPAFFSSPGWTAQWDITPTISARETYTDNLSLAPDASKRSDWVSQAIPGISVTATGARLRLNANYAPEFTYYARGQQDNQIYQRLSASSNAELARQLLFLDAGANVDRYNTSVQAPLATDNINITGSRVTVNSYLVSPYLLRDFGSQVQSEARFTYSVVNSDDTSTLADSAANKITVRLKSGPAYKLLTWDLAYAKEIIGYEDRQDPSTETIVGNARRLITPTVALLTQVGYEKYDSGFTGSEVEGSIWSAGLEWTPTVRTRLAATAGERLHENTYSFDFSHRTRLTAWNANYKEEVTTTRSEFFIPATVSTAGFLDQLFVSQIPEPVARQKVVEEFIARTGLPPSLSAPVNFFTNELFLLRRWQGSAGVLGVRNVVIANVFAETREKLTGDLIVPSTGDFATSNTIRQIGTSFQWNWRITARNAWNLGGSYVRNELPDVGRIDHLTFLGMSLTRQFQPRLSGSFSYRRQQNDSNESASSYKENAVSATVQMRL